MGLFERMFGREPGGDLARAEELLGAGRAYDALTLVRRADERAERLDPEEATALRTRARGLEVRAREVLVGSALAEADRSEVDEEYDDAADWVAAAMEHAARVDELTAAERGSEDDGRMAALRRRRSDLRRRGQEAARQPSLMVRFEDDERPGPDPLDTEGTYGTLVGLLHEDAADLYLHRPLPFQKAYIDLNEGEFAAALAAFDALVAKEPGDPVVRFERGRARLATGDSAGAREDFEAVWEDLGDDPFDFDGEVSIPAFWAQAVMELGNYQEVADRLEPLADPRTGDATLVEARAGALRKVGTPEALAEARGLLDEALVYETDRDVVWMRMLVRLDQGDEEGAIADLERMVAPMFSTGDAGLYEEEAARTLVEIYLYPREAGDDGGDGGGGGEADPRPDRRARAGELLRALSVLSGGLTDPDDLRLAERYRRVAGPDDPPLPDDDAELDETDPLESSGF